jgi:hypothetical protein
MNDDKQKNGKSLIGKRYGSLLIVEFKRMRDEKNSQHREAIWRANCDCNPANFVLDTSANLKRKGMCEDCMKQNRRKRKEQP